MHMKIHMVHSVLFTPMIYVLCKGLSYRKSDFNVNIEIGIANETNLQIVRKTRDDPQVNKFYCIQIISTNKLADARQ